MDRVVRSNKYIIYLFARSTLLAVLFILVGSAEPPTTYFAPSPNAVALQAKIDKSIAQVSIGLHQLRPFCPDHEE